MTKYMVGLVYYNEIYVTFILQVCRGAEQYDMYSLLHVLETVEASPETEKRI